MDRDTVGGRIRTLRLENRLTLKEFGKLMDVSTSAVQAWENGLNVPTLEKLTLMAEKLHVSTDYLAGIVDKEVLKIGHLSEDQRKVLFTMMQYFEKEDLSKIKE